MLCTVALCSTNFLEIDNMENNIQTFPCVCGNDEGGILAMAKVPMQPWCQTYDSSTALARGTLFPALDLPYLGRKATE